jgi:hypothetical protein
MASPRIARWQRLVVEAFTQRLLLKATAAALAIIVWLIVTAKEPTEDVVPVRFAPVLDSTLALRDPPPPIGAIVAGRGEDRLKLYSTPLVIRRPIANDVPDTLVVDLSPRDVEIPPSLAGAVIVRAVTPSSLTLRFERTTSRIVPVASQLRVDPAAGAFTIRFEPESVQITGPRQVVARVDRVWTVRSTLPPDDSLPHLVDIDTARLGARVKPTQVKAYITRLTAAAPQPATPVTASPGAAPRSGGGGGTKH